MNADTENVELDFKHLIECALNHKISWPALKTVFDSATKTLKESKKLNNILLEELEVMQSKQIQKKEQKETHSMFEHEPSKKDKEISFCSVDQDCENDDAIYNCTEVEDLKSIVAQEDEIDSATNEKSIDLERLSPQLQSDVLEGSLQTETLESEDILIVRNDPEKSIDTTIPYEDDGPSNTISQEEIELKVSEDSGFPDSQVLVERFDHKSSSSEKEEGISTAKDNEQKDKIEEGEKLKTNNKRKYFCKTCGQLFLSPNHLLKHKRIHSESSESSRRVNTYTCCSLSGCNLEYLSLLASDNS